MGHGIDTDFFSADPSVARGNWLLSVGRLMPSKRHDLAIRQAQAEGKELRIAGEGPEQGPGRRLHAILQLPAGQRNSLLNRIAVSSLKKERSENRSLALLRPEIISFRAVRRAPEDIEKQRATYAAIAAQKGLFEAIGRVIPRDPCPYDFIYRYRDDDGVHNGTCQDWETEATFFRRLQDRASEQAALDWMQQKFGEEYPRNGMALAMGTHRHRPDQWLVNGIIRMTDSKQQQLL